MSLRDHLLAYWPTADDVNHCIRYEAETLHEAVLLAVHQPYPLSYRDAATGSLTSTNENALFDHLVTQNVHSGAHIVPITGRSGAGKSHMVRILAARLQRENADGHYVIIRIPKSANLRQVVELILEKLPEEDYATIRHEFSKAMDELNCDDAVINFEAELEKELISFANSLSVRLDSEPNNLILRQQLGHARALPNFMCDRVIYTHFRQQVYPRIVNRAIHGQKLTEDEDSIEDFRASDFDLPNGIDINTASESARRYYITNLRNNTDNKITVARLLNEKVVDGAVRNLFKLQQALGGMTLQDVILEIRRQLHKDKKELVILVEDFAALTGIQNTLLNVLIVEGVRDGVETLATIRSVIAVTDGYLSGRDTIATRAGGEYIVESELSNDREVVERTRALVASYLNASRWGYRGVIERAWGQATDKPTAWMATAQSEHSEYEEYEKALRAFNDPDNGETIPLFPYTPVAIEQLAALSLDRKDGNLVFSPRVIIRKILHNILLQGRSAFEEGSFPHNINVPPPNAEIAAWLANLPEPTRDRYRRVVQIWGNKPERIDNVGAIPREVFRAFNLEPPQGIPALPPSPSPPSPKKKDTDNKTSEPSLPNWPSGNDTLVTALENWSQNNESLPQKVANQIRKSIAKALNESLDWEAERCSPNPIKANQISLPNAGGEGNIERDIIVSEDHSDPTGELRMELAGVTRFYELSNGRMTYTEADNDLIMIASLVERLMPKMKELVRTKVRRKLGMVTRLLSTNSRILGLKPAGNTPKALGTFLFSKVEGLPPLDKAPDKFVAWSELQAQALTIRFDLIRQVARYSGSFQGGTGNSIYAVDMPRIAWSSKNNEDVDLNKLDLTIELRQILNGMREATVANHARHAINLAKDIRIRLLQELGDDVDKGSIAQALESLSNQLRDTGAWDETGIGMTVTAFNRLCGEFKKSALLGVLKYLAEAEQQENQDTGKFINLAGSLDIPPLVIAQRFTETARRVVSAAHRRANLLDTQNAGAAPEQVATDIQGLFEALLNELNALESPEEGHAFN